MEWPWIQGRAVREGCDLRELWSDELVWAVASYFELVSVTTKEEHEARDKMKAEMERVTRLDLLNAEPSVEDRWSGGPADQSQPEPEIMTESPVPGIREMPLG